MSGGQPQRWDLSVEGRSHRVEIGRSHPPTIRWYVDGELVAAKKSSDDHVRLKPGDRLGKDTKASTSDPSAQEQPDVGALGVRFTALRRPHRVTWYQARGDVPALARALLGSGGIDFDPEPGSPAALREERIRRNPRRHALTAVAGGVGRVVVPLLFGLLVVQIARFIPWPDWNLPSVPWPSFDPPSIPTPRLDLPDWQAPGWLSWLADMLQYVWPVLLAWALARREIKRRRTQDALKARRKAEALGESGGRADPPTGPSRTG